MEPHLDSRITVTQREQLMVLNDVNMLYHIYATVPPKTQRLMMELQRDNHLEYLLRGLHQLGPSFCSLDANRPWICYWILHAIALLGEPIDVELEERTIDFLSRCQDPSGGYGGGPGQLPHLATTYAAVNALISLGGDKSLSSINRSKMYTFLKRMKDPNGAFSMHDGGEIDVRACYTAISVARILNILDDALVQNVGDFIKSCQTYEGGIAGEPGSEAHGGYTFCGLATMILINEADRLDLTALMEWVVFRQGVEGGFQGRTNKLVDGCYSFWQGGVLALLQGFHSVTGEIPTPSDLGVADCNVDNTQTAAVFDISEREESSVIGERPTQVDVGVPDCRENDTQTTAVIDTSEGEESEATSSQDDEESHFQQGERGHLFHSFALQRYILLCSQDPGGGLKDKPKKPKDYYHTCYCLSGLSVCQHSWLKDDNSTSLPRAVLGPHSNLLEPIHPVFNIVMDRYYEADKFFSKP